MMVNPTKKEKEIHEKVRPWLRFNAEKEEFCLIDTAPDDVKKAWKEWQKIAEEKRKNPFYQDCG